eukprot:1272122-Prorocentrum_lima.AAC.1
MKELLLHLGTRCPKKAHRTTQHRSIHRKTTNKHSASTSRRRSRQTDARRKDKGQTRNKARSKAR